jgi:hypothetical protein
VTFPDFEEFIASLNAHHVRYLIVGGYAVGYHARPRATKDIEILVDRTAANARRTCTAIHSFLGSSAPNINETTLMDPRTLIVLGVAPVRIDVLTSIDGVTSFGAAWKRRAEGLFGRVSAHFISLEDLIAAKVAAGRPQDLADADVLRRAADRRRSRRKR